MPIDDIQSAIPHRAPFLLIDKIIEQTEERIVCQKKFTGDEFWYQGHYPEYPLTPGVLLCESALQAGAVLLSSRINESEAQKSAGIQDGVPVATRLNNVQFRAMGRPGDEILLEVELTEQLSTAFFMKAKVMNASTGKLAARLDFACTLAAKDDL